MKGNIEHSMSEKEHNAAWMNTDTETHENLFGVHPSGCEFASRHAKACTPNAKTDC
jgi:hypothetical protein